MDDKESVSEQPAGEFILYTSNDGNTRVECRFEDETIWLSQALMAELFDRDVRTINEHLINLYDEAEINEQATIRNFRIVRQKAQTLYSCLLFIIQNLPFHKEGLGYAR